jgi:hypothetical protein
MKTDPFDEPCRHCGGSCYDDEVDCNPCRRCGGTGREPAVVSQRPPSGDDIGEYLRNGNGTPVGPLPGDGEGEAG